MKLNKRYIRNIKANLSFYMSAGILTFVTLLLFYLFYMAGAGINSFGEAFFTEQKLEDAHFTTYLPISDEDIKSLEAKYNLTLEKQQILNITSPDNVTARVFSVNEKINLYDVTEGNDLKCNNDIIISEGYALHNNINIGDIIKLQEKEFTVTGYFQRPDYLYMLKEPTDSYKNITSFFLAYVTEEVFEYLGDASVTYHVRYNEDNNIAFRQAINNTYYLQSYLDKDNNPRITMVDEQAVIYTYMSYILLVVMPLVTVVLICIILSRKVKDEQKIIGTLSAFGYSKPLIMMHYAGFAAIPGIIGGIISYIILSIMAQPYGELCLADYEPMRVTFSLPVSIGIVGIIVPTIMYIIAAIISVAGLLKNDTVTMLSGFAGNKNKMKRIFVNSNISFRKKFAIRSLLGNPARAFAVLLGIFLGSYMILLGFGMKDSVRYVSNHTVDDFGSFEYEYILNTLQTEEPKNGEKILLSSFESNEGTSLTFLGVTENNTYFDLKNLSGEPIDLNKGFYISNVASIHTGLQAGDTLKVHNPLSLEEKELEIMDIISCDVGMYIFTSLDNMNELMELNEGNYNAIVSDKELDIDDKLIRHIIKKDATREQAEAMLDEMSMILYSLTVLGIIICIASIYVAVNMMIAENRSNISMLKVLGYHDSSISRIVLIANHILLPLGILLSIPAAIWSINSMFRMLLNYVGILVTAYINLENYILTIILTAASYFGSVWFISRKTKKVNMVEALKDNRE